MPLPNENARPPSTPVAEDLARSREAFCRALKAARQRRGVTLDHISEVTKVCVTYFEALERNDVQHWPKGLFRRAFFKGYAEMIGVRVPDAVEEFVRLFPEGGDAASAVSTPPPPANPLRLGLDTSWHGPKTPFRSRIVTAAVDAVLVFVGAAGLVVGTSLEVSTSIAIAAVAYFTLSRLLLGDSPVSLLDRFRSTPANDDNVAAAPEADTDADREEQEARAWHSDARRVRAREGRREMRVRIKVPSHPMHH